MSWDYWIYFRKPKQSKYNSRNHKVLLVSKEKWGFVLANIKDMWLCACSLTVECPLNAKLIWFPVPSHCTQNFLSLWSNKCITIEQKFKLATCYINRDSSSFKSSNSPFRKKSFIMKHMKKYLWNIFQIRVSRNSLYEGYLTLHFNLHTLSAIFYFNSYFFYAVCLLEDDFKKLSDKGLNNFLRQLRLKKYLMFFHIKYVWIPFLSAALELLHNRKLTWWRIL